MLRNQHSVLFLFLEQTGYIRFAGHFNFVDRFLRLLTFLSLIMLNEITSIRLITLKQFARHDSSWIVCASKIIMRRYRENNHHLLERFWNYSYSRQSCVSSPSKRGHEIVPPELPKYGVRVWTFVFFFFLTVGFRRDFASVRSNANHIVKTYGGNNSVLVQPITVYSQFWKNTRERNHVQVTPYEMLRRASD